MYAFHFAGEVVSIPLPYAISSIWPLPFGLLLQKSTDGGRMVSSSSSLLNARDLNRPNKEYGLSYNVSCQANTMETDSKANGAIISSHLVLKHPLEEPQVYIVQRNLRFYLVVVACLFCFFQHLVNVQVTNFSAGTLLVYNFCYWLCNVV